MIRTTITKREFEALTWMNLPDVASDINDIAITLVSDSLVEISVFGYSLKTLTLNAYNEIVK